MADLSIDFAGIRSPNPFWLASAPPTNSGAQIHRAFEYGWGGAYHSQYWVDPVERLTVSYMIQLIPAGDIDDVGKLRALIYQALE